MRRAKAAIRSASVGMVALSALLAFGGAGWLAACGSSNDDSLFDAGGGANGDATMTNVRDGGDTMLGDDDSGTHFTNPLGDAGCTTSEQCEGGVCVTGSGMCCDTAAHVCGTSCCTGSTVCLASQCVTPGKSCHSGNDCASGQYCEPSLGAPAGNGGTAPMEAGCTQALPVAGRCLPLPPTCAGDAGASIDGGSAGDCIESCEYHPPGGGPLTATTKWSWAPTAAKAFSDSADIWATPTVGRLHDNNCDGTVDSLDSPSVVFVSGDVLKGTNGGTVGTNCQSSGDGGPSGCHTGVLRLIDGQTGAEVWSLDKPSAASVGFAGTSVALGDIDGDGLMDIVALDGSGYVIMVDRNGVVKRTSDIPIATAATNDTFGWGGGVAIADMDGDGHPEIAYGSTVYSTTNNAITKLWAAPTKDAGTGGEAFYDGLSTFVDLDGAGDGHLELLAGKTAYKFDGSELWNDPTLPDGFSGVADFDGDHQPDVVLVGAGKVWILNATTGAIKLGPVTLPGKGSGGPPTAADFDGDGKPEIGVAMQSFYSVLKPDFLNSTLAILWQTPNHDLSSSVTGSTVFDFEGDGKAEVIYADECYLWVFNGADGTVRYSTSHTSFTGTEASLVADVDGDGHAELLMVSNAASPQKWGCVGDGGAPTVVNNVTWKPGPALGSAYRGLTAFGDSADSWVGTRTLWNEHTYHVSNVCDDRDTACASPNTYGSIPKVETKNWSLPWLNNFRQNVQDHGVYNAPDAVVTMNLTCSSVVAAAVAVRNIGEAGLPSGVQVGVYLANGDMQVGTAATAYQLLPGQTATLDVALPSSVTQTTALYAKIITDPAHPTFHECHADNNTSAIVTPSCSGIR